MFKDLDAISIRVDGSEDQLGEFYMLLLKHYDDFVDTAIGDQLLAALEQFCLNDEAI